MEHPSRGRSAEDTYLQESVLKVLVGIQLVLQDWGPATAEGLYGTIQTAVPRKEPPESFALLLPVSADAAVAPGRHTRARVVQVVGGDRGAHEARVGAQAARSLVWLAAVGGAGGRRAEGLEGQEAGPADPAVLAGV